MSPDAFALPIALIVVYALLAHAVMLFNDGLYWDGWLVDSWQRNRSWPVMKRFYAEVGLAPLYYQHRWLGAVPRKFFVYRLIAFGSLLLGAIAVYCIARQSGLLAQPACLAIALLYLSYTGYHMNVDTVVGINYTVPTALFYWAAWLALAGMEYAGPAHWSLRLASLLLFALSFNANSLLVYYFGFLGLHFYLGLMRAGGPWQELYAVALHSADYVVLPFAYWFLKNLLTPRHGHYVDYNRLQLWSWNVPLALLYALRFGVESALTAPIRSAGTRHYLWLLVATFLAASYAVSTVAAPTLVSSRDAATLLAIGPALLFLAAVPYALVGQKFFADGWATKNHMLFHLPVALISIGTLSLVLPEQLLLPAIAVILVANAVHLNLTYLHYLAAWVKNYSWLHKLSGLEKARQASVLLIEDRHSIRADPSIVTQEHRPAYLFYMFEWLWGDKRRFGIPVVDRAMVRLPADEVAKQLAATTLDYDMRQVDVHGPQINVIISDGARRTPTKVALLYLYERYLPGGKLEPLLESVTDLKLAEPIP